MNSCQTDSSNMSCKKSNTCKSLETKINSRQGLSRNKIGKFSDINSRKHLPDLPQFWSRQHAYIGNGNWTRTFLSQTFRAPLGYPGKIPGYPAQKVWFPVFWRTYQTFWPPPVHVEDPYPTGKYPDQKVWVWVPFSSLNLSSLSESLSLSLFLILSSFHPSVSLSPCLPPLSCQAHF